MILLGASAVVPVLEGQFGGHRRRRPRGHATGLSPGTDCADWPTPGGQAEATGQHGQQAETAATQEDRGSRTTTKARPEDSTATKRRRRGSKGSKRNFLSWSTPPPGQTTLQVGGHLPRPPLVCPLPLACLKCLSFLGRNAKERFFPCAEISPQIRGDNFHYLKISERNSIFQFFLPN